MMDIVCFFFRFGNKFYTNWWIPGSANAFCKWWILCYVIWKRDLWRLVQRRYNLCHMKAWNQENSNLIPTHVLLSSHCCIPALHASVENNNDDDDDDDDDHPYGWGGVHLCSLTLSRQCLAFLFKLANQLLQAEEKEQKSLELTNL